MLQSASSGQLSYAQWRDYDGPDCPSWITIICHLNDKKKQLSAKERTVWIEHKATNSTSDLAWATQRIIQSKRNGNKLACLDDAHAFERAGYSLQQANACGFDIRTWSAFLTTYPV